MTAIRRVTFEVLGGCLAALSFTIQAPALAQNSEAPVDVTAAPPTSNDTIGPSQLQNFNLQGTVTRPADRPATNPATPSPNPPAQSRPEPVPKDTATAGPDRAPPIAQSLAAQPANSAARQATPASDLPAVGATTPSLPLDVRTGTAPQPAKPSESIPAAAALGGSEGIWSWSWLAAMVALIGGGAFIAWSRRGRRRRYGDPGRMAFAGLTPDAEVEPAPLPPARPRPDPVPPRAQPAPRPDPVPPPAAKPASRPVVDDGLIKSTGLRPELNFQFVPDRAVVTEREVMLQFDVVLTNNGAAPARDVLVEAKLVPAHAGQDQEIAAFFQQPEATGDRMAGIPPLGKVSLKSAVRLPLDQLHSFEVEGRRLFVPLVAFNILFRSSGGEGQASASFLVGRGNDGDDKLAPFRLDLGPRIFRGLSARPHSMGLSRQ